jgi:hypothetical protein
MIAHAHAHAHAHADRRAPTGPCIACTRALANAPAPRPRPAKKSVGQILRDFGWSDPIDLGGIEGSRLLEPMCLVWVFYGARTGTWNHAFKLLRG